jgi:hypothetical protein
MGHIAPKAMKPLVNDGLVTGVDLDASSGVELCNSYAYAKMMCKPVPHKREGERANEFGAEVHSDVWGPSPIKTIGGKAYYVSFTDDKTRHTQVHLLTHKSNTLRAYVKFEAWAQTQHGAKIKALHTNHGGEYLSNAFGAHLSVNETICRITVHDMLEQNGVSERLNRTLLKRARAMLHASTLPKSLWGEAVNHGVWLKNHTSTKALDGKMLHEALTGSKPDLSNLREWGSKVWVHNLSGSKLNGRAKEVRWVGFNMESKASCVYWPEKHSIRFDKEAVLVPGSIPLEGEWTEVNCPTPNPSNRVPLMD